MGSSGGRGRSAAMCFGVWELVSLMTKEVPNPMLIAGRLDQTSEIRYIFHLISSEYGNGGRQSLHFSEYIGTTIFTELNGLQFTWEAISISMDYLIFFAFSLMVSPLTKIPFPLYGSGFLHILIFAAN